MSQGTRSERSTWHALAAMMTLPGASTFECFAVFDPASSRWNTAQTALPWGSDEFSATWPRLGTMRSGVASAPPLSARPSDASGSTSLHGSLFPGTSERLAEAHQEWGPRGEKMKLNPDWYEAALGLRPGFTAGLPRPKRRRTKASPRASSSSTTT